MVIKFLKKLEMNENLKEGGKNIPKTKRKKKRTLIATEIPPMAFYLSYKRQDEY